MLGKTEAVMENGMMKPTRVVTGCEEGGPLSVCFSSQKERTQWAFSHELLISKL